MFRDQFNESDNSYEMPQSISLPSDLMLTYEDLYYLKDGYRDASGVFHDGFWKYEQIRNQKGSGVVEFLTTVTYFPATSSGNVELLYQTVGNGFMLWHRFRLGNLSFIVHTEPSLVEMRYQADKIIHLYLNKKG